MTGVAGVYLLFDHFDVHEVVPIIANSDSKVHGNRVVFARLEHRDTGGGTQGQVYIDPVELWKETMKKI